MDRAVISVAAPLIAKDIHLDPAGLGVAFSIFFFAGDVPAILRAGIQRFE